MIEGTFAKQNATTAIPDYQCIAQEVELFHHAWRCQLPLLLKGPTGCGKTRFVEHMAATLNRPLYTVACHDDLSAADLLGRHLIGEKGTYWQDGPLTRAVREGAICYLDEVIEARKDTTVVLHPLTDNRRMLLIDRTGETLYAAPEFMLVVSYNPGYQSLLKGMKPSTRQRFVSLSFDYPNSTIETEIVSRESGIDPVFAERLVDLAHALRALKNHDLEEAASTRLLVHTALLVNDGFDAIEACRSALVEPLSDDADTITALMEVVQAKLL